MIPTSKCKPNILLVLTDDQGPWAMGCAGNDEIRTPNLDRLAREGTRFANFFCASPVCSPARATLLTGRIPSQHGIHDWLADGNIAAALPHGHAESTVIDYLADIPAYTDSLAAAGYECGLSGKWHLGNSRQAQKSFSFWQVHAVGGGPYYKAPMIYNGELREESRYVTDAITENALDFLCNRPDDTDPFYLSVHYTAPHSPWDRAQHPTDLYDDYYENCRFESVPSDLSPPDWAQHLSIPVTDAETRRSYLSGYFAAVTAMDKGVGQLLDYLDKHDLRENTLVIFTSDNGMNMGHHGVFGKGNATFPLNMFDESVKVPFIASHRGRIPEGRVVDELVSQYDFLPTLLDYVGIGAPADSALPGSSFTDLLEDREQPRSERQHVVVFDEYGPVRMIRTVDWKYVHRYPYGPHELYDLQQDPTEEHNLIQHPECSGVLSDLRGNLTEWFQRYATPELDGAREAVSGCGQTGLAGTRARGRVSFPATRTAPFMP